MTVRQRTLGMHNDQFFYKNQFFPDYTPFSLTGSAHHDGDRHVERTLSPGNGIVVFLLAAALMVDAILW
ncbi:MAG: hypothetical protein AAGD11_01825 [Planctomycetota bacterium]